MSDESRPPKPMFVSEAARVLECCADTVRRLEATGVLVAVRTSAGVRVFNADDVRRVAAERLERRR